MKWIAAALAAAPLSTGSAGAEGWASGHRHVKPSGNCSGMEVLASYYSLPGKTATGEAFRAGALAAAARTWPLGTVLTVTTRITGDRRRSLSTIAGRTGQLTEWGARLDLTPGAAREIGMRSTQFVCVGQ